VVKPEHKVQQDQLAHKENQEDKVVLAVKVELVGRVAEQLLVV
jgi:hypothetical protein